MIKKKKKKRHLALLIVGLWAVISGFITTGTIGRVLSGIGGALLIGYTFLSLRRLKNRSQKFSSYNS
jgi:hypothetical protein